MRPPLPRRTRPTQRGPAPGPGAGPRLRARALPALIGGALLAGPTAAEPGVSDYEGCLRLVAEAPGEAEAAAARWEAQGGGAAARHCRAMALEALGAERAAAGLLMEIAAEARALPDRARAEMVLQAGELFLRLGALDAAGRAAEEALGLTGRAPGALAFRARLGAERGDWRGALADLDAALEGRPGDPGLLVLRASAKRRLGRLVAAADDARWARELAPEDPEAWLETGTIRAARGDRPGARAAFLEAIRLAGDGPLARAARLRLQALEAGG